MFNFGKSLINMNADEQKTMLAKSTLAQKRTAYEMGIGINGSQSRKNQQKQQKRDQYTDLDRLNYVTNKENKTYDLFGQRLESWKQGVTGKQSFKDTTQLKKQLDDHEYSVLSGIPNGGKRHNVLSETLPKIKSIFLQQGEQFAADKLNERSQTVLDKGLQRIANNSFGAKDEKDIQVHDDQAFELINKYVLSDAKFDEKDADAMYDKYLSYAGVETEEQQENPAAQNTGMEKAEPEAEKTAMAVTGEEGVPEQEEVRSSSEDAREMEKAAEAPPKDPAESARRVEQWEKETGNSVEDVEKHYTQQPGNKPTWMKESLGKTEYYEQRAKDFEERNPGKKAPDYYREYGDKYVKRFDELKPDLSEKGQEWLEKTKDRLQFKMEAGLRSGEWDESKPEELKEKAYDSHSEAYLEAGLAELPQKDIDKILTTVDRGDLLLSLDAIQEAAETAWELPREKKIGSVPAFVKWLKDGPSITE